MNLKKNGKKGKQERVLFPFLSFNLANDHDTRTYMCE